MKKTVRAIQCEVFEPASATVELIITTKTMSDEIIEAAPQDLTDIEDGIIKDKCFHCGFRQMKYRKMIGMQKTQSMIGLCTNKDCFRYYDGVSSPSWQRVITGFNN